VAKTHRYSTKILHGLAAVVLVLAGCSSSPTASPASPSVPVGDPATLGPLASPSPGTIGPEGAPIPSAPPLADLGKAATGQDVDGIRCETNEQVAYHIHAHLAIYVDGKPRQVPFGIGIPDPVTQQANGYPFVVSGKCFYWLHTHVADGVIHVESPSQRAYTLGQFFDIWGQPLTNMEVGPVTGSVTALYNGKVYAGADVRVIPLTAHADIQLDVGHPLVAPEVTDFGRL
jgi:hypothetical protein